MNLQDVIVDEWAEKLQKTMDFDILCDVLSSFGWTVIEIDYNPVEGQGWNDVVNWADNNFLGGWKEHAGKWLIEHAKDATMFALKWKTK